MPLLRFLDRFRSRQNVVENKKANGNNYDKKNDKNNNNNNNTNTDPVMEPTSRLPDVTEDDDDDEDDDNDDLVLVHHDANAAKQAQQRSTRRFGNDGTAKRQEEKENKKQFASNNHARQVRVPLQRKLGLVVESCTGWGLKILQVREDCPVRGQIFVDQIVSHVNGVDIRNMDDMQGFLLQARQTASAPLVFTVVSGLVVEEASSREQPKQKALKDQALPAAMEPNMQKRSAPASSRVTTSTQSKQLNVDEATLTRMANEAERLREDGQLDEAEALERHVLLQSQQLRGDQHPDTLTCMHNLALTLQQQQQQQDDDDKLEEAATLQRTCLMLSYKVQGPKHPDTLASMNNLAITLERQGNLDEAEALKRQALFVRKQVLGESHPDTLTSMNNLACTMRDKGDKRSMVEAAHMFQTCWETSRRVLGDGHTKTYQFFQNLVDTLRMQGKENEAAALAHDYYNSQGHGTSL